MTAEEKLKKTKWCPQHGYPMPCWKCKKWHTKEEWDEFFRGLAEAVRPNS